MNGIKNTGGHSIPRIAGGASEVRVSPAAECEFHGRTVQATEERSVIYDGAELANPSAPRVRDRDHPVALVIR